MVYQVDVLGLVRFFLAVSVVFGHLWNDMAMDCHRHAVIGFFCISGYLITRIRLNCYMGRPKDFLLNRILRIFPQYYVAVILGALVVILLPDAASKLNPALQWPVTELDWAKQVFIFGLYGSEVRLSPPTWSLNVEIYFYLIIGILTFQSEKGTYIALVISLVVGLLSLFRLMPESMLYTSSGAFYGSPIGNAFVFFIGSASYFVSKRFNSPKLLSPLAFAAFVINSYIMPRLAQTHIQLDMLLFISACLFFIVLIRPPVIHTSLTWLAQTIEFLGRLSYPLFLIHWASSVWLFSLIGSDNPTLFLGGLASSLLVSSALVLMVDRPIELIRNRIRAGSHQLQSRPVKTFPGGRSALPADRCTRTAIELPAPPPDRA